MRKSSSSFHFPDINVWLALSYERHVHHEVARNWFEQLGGDSHLCFCRFTQIGLLRLLTTEAIMGGDVLSQALAWGAYDSWLQDGRISLMEEPPLMEATFRALSRQKRPSPKDWADAYLLASATIAGIQLVTFDRALSGRASHLLVLGIQN